MTPTPRETVQKIISFKMADVIPYWLSPGSGRPEDSHLYERLNSHYGNTEWQKSIVNYLYGTHSVSGEPLNVSLADNCSRNAFGAMYKNGEKISHVLHHPLTKPSLHGYEWPKPEDLADWESLRKLYADAPIENILAYVETALE